MPRKPLTDRERQVATRKERHGENAYSDMAKKRLAKMTPEERSALATKAITKRHHPDWFSETGEQIKFKEEE